MEEKGKIKDKDQEILKLDWEVPKLYCLNTDKTEGGHIAFTTESYTGKES